MTGWVWIANQNLTLQGHHQIDVLNLWSPICDTSVWGTWGSGWAHSAARPWVPTSSPLTHIVHLLPFFSYLASTKSVYTRPFVLPPRIRWQIQQTLYWEALGSRGWAFDWSKSQPTNTVLTPNIGDLKNSPFKLRPNGCRWSNTLNW